MPYICVSLNLDEQLSHLSTATHLAFYLYTDGSARTRFMPNQSFVDNPKASLHLFQLGTDSLEGFFGLIRMVIGTDTNVDIMQLGSHASGLVKVAVILALHPEWDQSPQHLGLPMITKDTTTKINSKFNHINLASWHGSACVESVNLHTAWILGEHATIKLIPEAEQVFDDAVHQKLDMLSPFGTLLVNQCDEEDDFDCSELSGQYPSDTNTHQKEPTELISHRTHTLDSDLEDMIAEELLHGSISSEIHINGFKTTKPQALQQQMMHHTNCSLTNQLKQVQELLCFNSLEVMSPVDTDQSDSSPSIHIGNPIAILMECKKKLHPAVTHINQLHFAGNQDLMTLSTHLLGDAMVKVSFQILHIVPTTVKDNPSREYDWCWARNMEATCHDIPGELIQPINPEFLYKDGKAMYLLDSNFLLTLTADLLDHLTLQSCQGVPMISQTDHFPYHLLGKACFIGEHKVQDGVEDLEQRSVCSGYIQEE